MYGIETQKLWRVANGVQKPGAKMGALTAIPMQGEDILVKLLGKLIQNGFYLDLCNFPSVIKEIHDRLNLGSPRFMASSK